MKRNEKIGKQKKKIWKIILGLFLILILIFLLHTIRNLIIISNLQSKVEQYINSTNFHNTIYTYQGDTHIKTETYYLNGKQAVKIIRILNGEKTTIQIYSKDGEQKENMYIETADSKIAKINITGSIYFMVSNALETENLKELLIASITSSISSKQCNGKDCYLIKGAMLSNSLVGENWKYIDKQTGLQVRVNSGTSTNTNTGTTINEIQDFSFEFGTVTENDFIEPDINQYTVTNNE